MTAKKLLLFSVLLVCQSLFAQRDSIMALQEVIISDSQLHQFSNSQSVQTLNDSVIRRNAHSLTSLLNFQSTIYFKENGLGMVSSPSFRGTSAQQTAVIWNGININSQFNGQTDFNTITTRDFTSISIRAGGGSVLYGSSAIGGSIHLNNEVRFNSPFSNNIQVNYGSFNSLGWHYDLSVGSDRWSTSFSFSRNSSDNDYKFFDVNRKNLNGKFENTSVTGTIGYKINRSNVLRFYSCFFEDDKHFSLLTPTDTRTKYTDLNTRNLLEWTSVFNRFTSILKFATLSEEYQYFENLSTETPSFAKANTLIGKYDLAYRPNNKILINTIIEANQTEGMGSDLIKNIRKIASAALLLKHEVSDRFLYEASIRKEATNAYQSPVLFSLGTNAKVASFYHLKWNVSRNFRIPSYNDLFWSDGGNPNLKPESSYQTEIGNEFIFGNTTFSITGYYIKLTDMIQWLPGTTTSWLPQNVNKVDSYGGEALFNWKKSFQKHHLEVNATYAYTVSENRDTGFQLTYVPFHKAASSLGYSYKRFSADYQIVANGEVFTRSDNNSRYNLDPYTVSNIGMYYTLGKKESYQFGVRILNVTDQQYEAVVNRPFPGRNFTMNFNFNF